GKPSDLSATIDWGDGSTSPTTLVANAGGGYDVSGSHTYGGAGTKSGTVHVVDVGGAKADVPFTVNVVAQQVQGITTTGTTGGPTSGVQGIVTTPNTGGDVPWATAVLLLVSGSSFVVAGRLRRRL
ncbi:MAG TPA: hypothetical protein VGN08_05295, partial [Solirubrobacteraceae bacterium]